MEDNGLQEYKKFISKDEFDVAVNTFRGILKGIYIDCFVNDDEFNELKNWCIQHRKFVGKSPFNEIILLIETAMADNKISKDEQEDILWVCNNITYNNWYNDLIVTDFQVLRGLLHGILSDNQIYDKEIKGLKDWLDENKHLETLYPYDEIYSIIKCFLADNKIDDYEKDILKVVFSEFIDKSVSSNINMEEIEKLKKNIKISGICSSNPKIKFENNEFCFAGISSEDSVSDVISAIEFLNGKYNNDITNETNYLIIGDKSKLCWIFSCYGRKVEKAIEQQKMGQDIQIVQEKDFWANVQNVKKDNNY